MTPMLKAMNETLRQDIIPYVSDILKISKLERPTADRNDAFGEDISRLVGSARIKFLRNYSEAEIMRIVTRQGLDVASFNIKEFERIFKAVLGVEIPSSDHWLRGEIDAFTKQNVSLISSIPEEFYKKTEQTLLRDVMAGKSTDDIAEDLQKNYGISENKAALIARDQTSKFNGDLTRVRQQSVGLTKYIWSTSLDDRVRPEHEEREGVVFSWDDPPEDGHPSEAVNCRCVALPYVEPSDEE